jgi:hypothetical protein
VLSCFGTRRQLESAFFGGASDGTSGGQNGGSANSPPHPSKIFEAAAESFRTVKRQSPMIAVTTPDALHDQVPDLAQYIISTLSRNGGGSGGSIPTDVARFLGCSKEIDLVELFVSHWLPFVVPYAMLQEESTAVDDALHMSVADICCAVHSLGRFLSPTPLDASRFALRAIPGLWVPSCKEEERLAVPLLHWLKDHVVVTTAGAPVPQRVLHVGCSSGYFSDMIMKGTTLKSLLCVDHSAVALSATEEAIQEHWRMRRSSGGNRCQIEVATSPLLPTFATRNTTTGGLAAPRERQTRLGPVGVTAAQRRRKLARAHRSGAVLEAHQRARVDDAAPSLFSFPVDVVCVTGSLASAVPSTTPWEVEAQETSVRHDSPYSCRSGVRKWMSSLLSSTGSPFGTTASGTVCALLPFSNHARAASEVIQEILAEFHARPGSDNAVPWRLVHNQVSCLCPTPQAVDAFVSRRSTAKLLQHRAPKDPIQRRRFLNELGLFLSKGTGSELVVLQRDAVHNATSGRLDSLNRQMVEKPEWKDTFEYQQYLPKSGPTNPFHWTSAISSFPHLDPSNSSEVLPTKDLTSPLNVTQRQRLLQQRNDLSTTMGRSQHIMDINASAASNICTVFGHELRAQRRSRARKLAFASQRNVEWYLDEKVVKSEAARVEIMNEVLKKMGGISANPK